MILEKIENRSWINSRCCWHKSIEILLKHGLDDKILTILRQLQRYLQSSLLMLPLLLKNKNIPGQKKQGKEIRNGISIKYIRSNG